MERVHAWMYLIATHLGTAVGVLPVLGLFAARTIRPFPHSRGVYLIGYSNLRGLSLRLIIRNKAGLADASGCPHRHRSLVSIGIDVGRRDQTGITVFAVVDLAAALRAVAFALAWVVTGLMGILYALPDYKRWPIQASKTSGSSRWNRTQDLGRTTHQPLLAALGFSGALARIESFAFQRSVVLVGRRGAARKSTATWNSSAARAAIRPMGLPSARRDLRESFPPLNGFVSEFLPFTAVGCASALGSQFVTALAMIGAASLAYRRSRVGRSRRTFRHRIPRNPA
jgi:hypothetical protein